MIEKRISEYACSTGGSARTILAIAPPPYTSGASKRGVASCKARRARARTEGRADEGGGEEASGTTAHP